MKKKTRSTHVEALYSQTELHWLSVIVRETLICASPIEAKYYNAVLVHFHPVCYYGGLGENSLVDDDEMRKLRTCCAVVLPLFFCVKARKVS